MVIHCVYNIFCLRSHVEWSYDGQFIAVAHSTNRVVVHPRPGSASEAVTLPAPRSPVTALAFQVRDAQRAGSVCDAWERKKS